MTGSRSGTISASATSEDVHRRGKLRLPASSQKLLQCRLWQRPAWGSDELAEIGPCKDWERRLLNSLTSDGARNRPFPLPCGPHSLMGIGVHQTGTGPVLRLRRRCAGVFDTRTTLGCSTSHSQWPRLVPPATIDIGHRGARRKRRSEVAEKRDLSHQNWSRR